VKLVNSYLNLFFLFLMTSIMWTVLVYQGTSHDWWRAPLAAPGDHYAFVKAMGTEIDANNRGNVAYLSLKNAQTNGEHFASVGNTVNQHTLFQVASLSKWITAYGVMQLVQEDKISLDSPVSKYITRWQLPESDFNNHEVTARRLLSHTAGLTDGLGFLGFEPGQSVQTLEQALAEPNATKGPGVTIQVGIEPGTEFIYSGGGYLILQLLIEEVSGLDFETYMQQAVFQPLKMTRSTFVPPGPKTENVALSYNTDGTPSFLYQFTAVSAAGLYTTAADMALFLKAQIHPEPSVLSAQYVNDMRTPHGVSFGQPIWGLGTTIYAGHDNDFIVGHAGQNEPAINTDVRYNPITGDGFVLLQSGSKSLASILGGQWVYWQTGKLDLFSFLEKISTLLLIALCGIAVSLVSCLVLAFRLRKTSRTTLTNKQPEASRFTIKS